MIDEKLREILQNLVREESRGNPSDLYRYAANQIKHLFAGVVTEELINKLQVVSEPSGIYPRLGSSAINSRIRGLPDFYKRGEK